MKDALYSILLLVLLTVFLYIRLRKILEWNFANAKNNHERIQNEYDRLFRQNAKLKQDNVVLEKTADEIIVLYDITKEICKYLDTQKVFLSFKEQLDKYIEVVDCKLLESDADLSAYGNYAVLPLKIDDKPVGYLAANIINEKDKDKFHILAQQFILGMGRALLYQKVQEMAVTDSLTQVFSRRYFLERFNEEIERSRKFKYYFSFLMVDIDHFKDYNDHYGHLVGDAILRDVSKTIKENIRQIDLMGRYGGEEFTIVLTETDKKEAQFAAERIRRAIEDKTIKVYDEDLKVTISIGISAFPQDSEESQALIDRADEAMYRAKQTGRNKVYVYGEVS